MNPFEDVKKFMEIAHPDKISSIPRIPPQAIDDLCENLINEELKELREADENEDLVEMADAIADLIWVLVCKAMCYGIPLTRVWAEVARTNLAKFPDGKVIRRPSDGKIMKPEGWQPPDIKRILEEAKNGSELSFEQKFGQGYGDTTGDD